MALNTLLQAHNTKLVLQSGLAIECTVCGPHAWTNREGIAAHDALAQTTALLAVQCQCSCPLEHHHSVCLSV